MSAITGVDEDVIKIAIGDYAQRVQTYLNDHPEVDGTEGILGKEHIIIQEGPGLPSGLPNMVVLAGARYDKLPDKLQHSVKIELFNSTMDRTLSTPNLSTRIAVSRIGTHRLGITYLPATAADSAVIEDALASAQETLPLYLIYVRPTIQLDGVTLAEGISTGMGSDQYLDIVLTSPLGQSRMAYNQVAGDEMVVGANAAGITRPWIDQFNQAVYPESAAKNLHQISLHYWYEADLLAGVLAKMNNVKTFRMPSVGIFSSPLSVVYSWGVPNRGHYIRKSVDIKRSVFAVSGEQQDAKRDFIRQSGVIASYLESSILEQLIYNWQGTGASAIQSLLDANLQNIPIYRINAANVTTVRPLLAIADEGVLIDINTAINAGFEVIVPERAPVKAVGVSGIGYILRDPVTGAASYRIAGGLDGGAGEMPCAIREPQPKAVASVRSETAYFLAATQTRSNRNSENVANCHH